MNESRVWLLAPFALLGAVACGPSMRTLVESDMRFEHCYRIDDDPKASLEHKRSCWSQWTVQYARGQDRARVHYAKQRLNVLDGALATSPTSAGPSAPAAAPPSPATPYAPPPAVAPMSPYAPPPAVVPSKGGEVAAASPACAEACNKTWKTCTAPCSAGASTCLTTCDASFRGCVKSCL